MERSSKTSALLVMDIQYGILNSYSKAPWLIRQVIQAVEKARNNNTLIIYGTLGFRPGLPEISNHNAFFTKLKKQFADGIPDMFPEIDASLTPEENDIHIIKHRLSTFTGSDLEIILRSKAIQHLILTGISTSGVVASTLREAVDKDYKVTVLSDCCGDKDEEVHQILINKVFPKMAKVITVKEWNGK